MKVSYNWLNTFFPKAIPLEELLDILIRLGFEVSSKEKINNDTIIDIDVPISRHDALSLIGLARDICAFLKMDLVNINIEKIEENLSNTPKIIIEDPSICPRYTGRIIDNIKILESSSLIKQRLESCGIRPINNIVDITNYVLLEMGHPMHSFDYDKLEGDIFIRRGRKNEKLLCLDGNEYYLEDSIIIADSKKPIAIGGIIGGEETSVKPHTKTILLEVAYFSPIEIRKASKRLGITTESSYRFSRMIDPEGLIKAQDRAANLILESIKEARIGPIVDIYPNPFPLLRINLRKKRVNKILGTNIKEDKIIDILKRLEFEINKGIVKIPSFRGEVTREIDIIEEIARIYGYSKIKEKMPKSPIIGGRNERFYFIRKIREIMRSSGMDEVITYSFTNRKTLSLFSLSNIVPLKSPLSSEYEILTPSLIPGLLEVAKINISRQEKDLSIFEIGNVFEKEREYQSLAGLMTGKKVFNFLDKRDFTLYDMLGVIKRLFLELGIDCSFIKREIPFLKNGLDICFNDKRYGIAGILNDKIQEYYKIKNPVFLFELDVSLLVPTKKVFKEFSKYPKVELDLCLVVPKNVKSKEIEEIIKEQGMPIIKDVFLYDIYKDTKTYRIIYQEDKRTLTMDEIERIKEKTLQKLKGLNIELRK